MSQSAINRFLSRLISLRESVLLVIIQFGLSIFIFTLAIYAIRIVEQYSSSTIMYNMLVRLQH